MSLITNVQAFASLPTCTQTPSSGSQLITKTYGDATYAAVGSVPTLSGANAWTGTNTFNSNLPTSTLTPSSGNQLITKTFADATYGALGGLNTWAGASNIFNANPYFPSGATVGYVATCTNGTTGAWSWQANSSNTPATVSTSDATPTTIATIATTSNSVFTVTGEISGAKSDYSDATGGTFSATVLNNGSTTSVINTPFVVVNASSSGTFNVTVSGSNILIQVTGLASSTYNWKCTYQTVSN